MGRETKTLRIDEEVDDWLDKFSDEADVHRSDVVNRALKVYAAKTASGEWKDPKFRDRYDQAIEDL